MHKEIFHMAARVMLLVLLWTYPGSKVHAQFEVVEDSASVHSSLYFDSLSSFSNDDVQVREVPDSTWKELKKDDAYWYADLSPKRKNENSKAETATAESGWFGTLVWVVIIISMVSVLIWFLASSDIRLFRKPSSTVVEENEEVITEDIFAVDYDNEIRKAKADQNYRMAIRLFYLRTLKELSDLELIRYKHESTNREYLSQLSRSKYYNDFFRLTRDFEYTWYGKFELSPDLFIRVENDFSQFKHRLGS